jgi:hypothetical protein
MFFGRVHKPESLCKGARSPSKASKHQHYGCSHAHPHNPETGEGFSFHTLVTHVHVYNKSGFLKLAARIASE